VPELYEGTGLSGSSVVSRLQALDGLVTERMKGALRLGILCQFLGGVISPIVRGPLWLSPTL
jgi:hypothetical protein